MPRISKSEREEALNKLRAFLKPGDIVYCVLRSVSRSGMSRKLDFYCRNGEDMQWLTGFMVRAGIAGMTQSDKDWRASNGATIQGCGMDMGFHAVYCLGHALWPGGFGEVNQFGARPESKEQAAKWRTQDSKFRGRNGDTSGWDNDGGYALKHRWL